MNIYRVAIADVIGFDDTDNSPAEEGSTERLAIVLGEGVEQNLAEKFARSAYRVGIEAHFYPADVAPTLLLSEATLAAMKDPSALPEGSKTMPVLAPDVAAQFTAITVLTMSGNELLVFEYEPGENLFDGFKR